MPSPWEPELGGPKRTEQGLGVPSLRSLRGKKIQRKRLFNLLRSTSRFQEEIWNQAGDYTVLLYYNSSGSLGPSQERPACTETKAQIGEGFHISSLPCCVLQPCLLTPRLVSQWKQWLPAACILHSAPHYSVETEERAQWNPFNTASNGFLLHG